MKKSCRASTRPVQSTAIEAPALTWRTIENPPSTARKRPTSVWYGLMRSESNDGTSTMSVPIRANRRMKYGKSMSKQIAAPILP